MEFATMRRTGRPNDYLLADKGAVKATPDGPSPAFDGAPDTVKAAMARVVEGEPNVKLGGEGAGADRWRLTQKTRVMGFVDDIDIEFFPLDAGKRTGIRIYSRSRVGYSDLGVNRRRIQRWLGKLADELRVNQG